MPIGNPFDNVEPHRRLPQEARNILWSACELVLGDLGGFAQADGDMSREFSAGKLRGRCREKFIQEGIDHLLMLRDNSPSCARRRAIRAGVPLAELMSRLGLHGADVAAEIWRQEDDRYRREWQDTKAKYRSKISPHDRPNDINWRLEQAVLEAKEAGLPAGTSELRHARRAVLLGCILSYQHPIHLPGEFCSWTWESVANPVSNSYVPGRETGLFTKFPDRYAPRVGTAASLEELIDLVSRAVRVVKTAAPAHAADRIATAVPEYVRGTIASLKPALDDRAVEVFASAAQKVFDAPADFTETVRLVDEEYSEAAFRQRHERNWERGRREGERDLRSAPSVDEVLSYRSRQSFSSRNSYRPKVDEYGDALYDKSGEVIFIFDEAGDAEARDKAKQCDPVAYEAIMADRRHELEITDNERRDGHPVSRKDRLREAIETLTKEETDAGEGRIGRARRLVVLAFMAAWPDVHPSLGDLGNWGWNNVYRNVPVGKRGHEMEIVAVEGRECVLFCRDLDENRTREVAPDLVFDLGMFIEKVQWAVNALPASAAQPTSSPRPPSSVKTITPKRSWTQPELDVAISDYKASRAPKFAELYRAINGTNEPQAKAAKDAASKLFGRNAIADTLQVRSPAMVTDSITWRRDIRDPLQLGRARSPAPRRVGNEIALENRSTSKIQVDSLVREETIARIRNSRMPPNYKDAVIQSLETGQIDDDAAEQIVAQSKDQQINDRTNGAANRGR